MSYMSVLVSVFACTSLFGITWMECYAIIRLKRKGFVASVLKFVSKKDKKQNEHEEQFALNHKANFLFKEILNFVGRDSKTTSKIVEVATIGRDITRNANKGSFHDLKFVDTGRRRAIICLLLLSLLLLLLSKAFLPYLYHVAMTCYSGRKHEGLLTMLATLDALRGKQMGGRHPPICRLFFYVWYMLLPLLLLFLPTVDAIVYSYYWCHKCRLFQLDFCLTGHTSFFTQSGLSCTSTSVNTGYMLLLDVYRFSGM
ncbi:hypothetical protein BD560DRAFT_426425 [Blakeslea trispora]|nr:hypothetical protein BD560DRAFT_426425 [Blakeslea trispora]